MRLGWPAASVAQVADVDYLLVFPPEARLEGVLEELSRTTSLKGKTILFSHPSAQLDSDLGVGAHACSIMPLCEFRHGVEDLTGVYFFVEGSPTGVRHARTMLRECEARVVTARDGSTPRVAAAALTAGDAVTVLVDFAVELLVDSGLPQKRAIDALGPLVSRALADYARTRGKTRPRTELNHNAAAMREHLEVLAELDPRQGRTYGRILRLTQELSERNCEDNADMGDKGHLRCVSGRSPSSVPRGHGPPNAAGPQHGD